MTDIRFIPTGIVFSLPEEEATRIVLEDRGNYEVIKGAIKEKPKESTTKKSVKELVVVDEEREKLIEKAKSLNIGGNLKTMKLETIKEKIAEKEGKAD